MGKKIGVEAHDQQDMKSTTSEPINATTNINQHNYPIRMPIMRVKMIKL
jgi:hypothetical protein